MGEASAVNRTLYTATALPVPADGPLPSGRGCRTRLPPLDGRRSAGRGRGAGLDDRGRRRPRIPRRRRRRDRRRRRARPCRDRRGDGRPGRPRRVRARQRLHHRAARGLRGRGRAAPPDGRPGDLPGLAAAPRRSRRPSSSPGRTTSRAASPSAGSSYRALGELPRQHARRARPVRPHAAPPAVRGLAGPVPARVRGLPVPRRRTGRQRPGRPARSSPAELERAIEAAGPGTVAAFVAEPIVGATLAAAVPPDGYWPRDRRGLPPARRPAHRRRGHDRVRADRALVRVSTTGACGRTSSSRPRAPRRATGRSGSSPRPADVHDAVTGARRLRPRVHLLARAGRRGGGPRGAADPRGRGPRRGERRQGRPAAGAALGARWASTRTSARSAAAG